MPNGSRTNARQETFDLLFSNNRSAVFSFFLGNLSDREEAKDQTQETFSRAWSRIDDLMHSDPNRQRFWVFSVARNVLTDYRRRQCFRKAGFERLAKGTPTSAMIGDTLEIQALDAAIAKLPEDRRLVLTMSVLGDLTSEEIGRILGQPAGTIRSTLHDARRRLSDMIDP